MSFPSRIRLFILAAFLLSGAPVMAGDAATSLPASLTDSLRAITAVNLDDMDKQARDSIRTARQRLNEVLQAQPVQSDRLATAYGELGGLYQAHLVFPAAADCYHNAMQLAPDEFRWAYYAAWLADTDGRTRQALEHYEHARRLKPGYQAVMVRMGNVLLDLNELERAQAAYEQVVDTTGLEAAALYGLGQIALLQRDYDTAIDVFTRALEFDPAASRIHYPLAQALRATQRNDEAKAQLAMLGDQPPTFRDPQIESLEALKVGSRIHFLQAMKAIKQQDYVAASKAFAEGVDMEPDNVLARISYARTLYLTGDKSGARQALEEALARQPDNSLGLFLLGVLTEEQGEADKAADYYLRAIHNTPDHAGANFYLANQYYREGKLESAVQHYASSIEGEAGYLSAYIPYIGTLILSNAPAATLKTVLETATRLFPENPVFQAMRIMLLAASRDTAIQDPEEALRSAQQLNDRYRIPPHQELLALAYAATGNYEQATAIQKELLSYTQQHIPTEADRVARTLSYYRQGKLPPLDDLIDRTALQAPPFIASTTLRDYPTARPY
jgi:tetratricopeptide (TPR) repeat protein